MKEKKLNSIEWLIDKWNEYPIEIGKAQFRRYLYEAKELHKNELISFGYNQLQYIEAEIGGDVIFKKVPEEIYKEQYEQ